MGTAGLLRISSVGWPFLSGVSENSSLIRRQSFFLASQQIYCFVPRYPVAGTKTWIYPGIPGYSRTRPDIPASTTLDRNGNYEVCRDFVPTLLKALGKPNLPAYSDIQRDILSVKIN